MEEKKFCKFCGELIDKSLIVCPKCGRQVVTEQKNVPTSFEKGEIKEEIKFYEQEWFMWLMLFLFTPLGIVFMFKFNKRLSKQTKLILTIIFSLLFIIVFFINMSDSDDNNINNDNIIENDNISNDSNKKDSYSFDEKFEFDDLEITIGSNYTFTTIDNRYSDYYGKDIIKLPITVKNLSNETHSLNMFYYSIYGSQGTEIKNVGGIYFDDNIDYAGDLRSDASYTKYMYLLYDGDGTYSIEFDDWFDEILVEINIQK